MPVRRKQNSEQGILQRKLNELREQHAALQNLEDQQRLSLRERVRYNEHLLEILRTIMSDGSVFRTSLEPNVKHAPSNMTPCFTGWTCAQLCESRLIRWAEEEIK